MWWTRVWVCVRVPAMAAALLLSVHSAVVPAPIDGMRMAGHDPVDPALRRFTGKVIRIGQADAADRVSTLRFDPIGPDMVAPAPNELRGWRVTFIKGKLFGQTLWVEGNTPNELTVSNTDPSLAEVVEGDILMIELLDPNVMAPSSRRDVDETRQLA